MDFEQLIISDEGQITEKQKAFLNTHRAIIYSGNMMADFAVSLAENLKKMRDEKLYIEAGFETFGQYTETACGLKERQAYNYVKVLESFDRNYLQSNAKLGVTKLCLIASLDKTERDELEGQIDIEDVSTRELKEEVQKLKSEREEQNKQYELDLSKLNTQLSKQVSTKEKLEKKIKTLETEIEDLKNKPAETIEVESEETKKELESSKKQVAEIKEILAAKEIELQKAKQEKELLTNEDLVEFRVTFNNLQDIVEKLKQILSKLPEDKKEKCKSALKAVAEVLC